MGLELKRYLKLFFQKNLKLDYHSSSFIFCIAMLFLMLKEHLQPSSLHVQ
jgi:hypothetical protein